MGLFDTQKEGKDYFIARAHGWGAPLAGDGSFRFEETLFSWHDKERSLSYPYGAADILIWINFDASEVGFFGKIGNGYEVCAQVDGILVLNRQWNTGLIKNKELRAAVELGLRAWQAQLAASQAAALDALTKHS